MPIPTPPPKNYNCTYLIDFSVTAALANLSAGTLIETQWVECGVHLYTNDPVNHPLMIFDSSIPTGSDLDLGSPNNFCIPPGPGVGNGGKPGEPGENCEPLGNLLIISEDGDTGDPDDNAGGGDIIFDFTQPDGATVHWIGIIDAETQQNIVIKYLNESTESIPIPAVGNNGFVNITIDRECVRCLTVEFSGSGGISAIAYDTECVSPPTPTPVPVPVPVPAPQPSPEPESCGTGCLAVTVVEATSQGAQPAAGCITYTFDGTNADCDVNHFVINLPTCATYPTSVSVSGCGAVLGGNNVNPCDPQDHPGISAPVKVQFNPPCVGGVEVCISGTSALDSLVPIGIKGGQSCSECTVEKEHVCGSILIVPTLSSNNDTSTTGIIIIAIVLAVVILLSLVIFVMWMLTGSSSSAPVHQSRPSTPGYQPLESSGEARSRLRPRQPVRPARGPARRKRVTFSNV